MKRILLACLLVCTAYLGYSQTDNFYYPSATSIDEAGLALGESTSVLEFLKNQAGDPITFSWKVLSVDTFKLGQGASVNLGVCDNQSCYQNVMGTQFDMNPVSGTTDYGQFKLQAFQVVGDLKIVVKVRVWDKSAPTLSDTIFMSWRTDNWVGLSEYKAASEVMVYPNPATNVLNVSYRLEGKGTFELVNLVGSTVYRKELGLREGKFTLNLEKLSRGVYFYSVKNTNGKVVSTKKLIVQ